MKKEETKNGKETGEEKFQRLAPPRVDSVLKKIRIFSNLSGPAYKFIDEQVTKIFTTIRSELEVVEAKFRRQDKKPTAFTL